MAIRAEYRPIVVTPSNRGSAETIHAAGTFLLRYGLVLVLAWIGAMKFTAYEANAIQPLVANSPFISWVYALFSVRTFATLLGVVEVGTAVMIAARPFSARVAALGSVLASLTFLSTLSFLLSTPGWEASLGGFPALSVVPGQFLVKDVVLLGAALWSLWEALQHSNMARP
jgi:reactive chlorine resistance protein C